MSFRDIPLPPNWEEAIDAKTGKPYYIGRLQVISPIEGEHISVKLGSLASVLQNGVFCNAQNSQPDKTTKINVRHGLIPVIGMILPNQKLLPSVKIMNYLWAGRKSMTRDMAQFI